MLCLFVDILCLFVVVLCLFVDILCVFAVVLCPYVSLHQPTFDPCVSSHQALVSTLQQHFLLFSQRLHSAEVERRSLRLEVANLKKGLRQERAETSRTVRLDTHISTHLSGEHTHLTVCVCVCRSQLSASTVCVWSSVRR